MANRAEQKQLWSPLDPENIQNPYPMYKRLRDEAPIHRSQTGEWIISRYDDVKSILKSPLFEVGNRLNWINRSVAYFKDKSEDISQISTALQSFILLMNPPDHTRIRRWIQENWDNREVENIINENINELLSQLAPQFEVVDAFASRLPAMTMTRILGLPLADYQKLKVLGQTIIRTLDLYLTYKDLVKINEAASGFLSYFRNYLHSGKAPSEGLLKKMLDNNQLALSEDEMISIFISLFAAGEETTVSFLSKSILHLTRQPDQLDLLRNDWSLSALTVEELLRYDPPAQLLGRIATQDMDLDGFKIKTGETVTLCVASANRDERFFDRPDTLDIQRNPNRHLAFGSGIHYCLGDWLGRIQGRLAIEAFFQRFENIKVEDNELAWNSNLAIRGLASLRLSTF
ncbi:MAG: cytochrome P450 [Bacteroidota bacterium]